MKFVRYGDEGREKPGILDSDGKIRDLSVIMNDLSGESLSYLDVFKSIDRTKLPEVQGNPRLGSPISGSGKLICIGLNYADHAEEAGMPVPSEPVIFMKATSAICGPNDPIILPRGSEKTDWEVELGVVIGKQARYVEEKDALDHVAGYVLVNDISERHFQLACQGQWTKGKSFDHFAPIGPWLVTPDEIKDIQNLKMWLKVNGETMQNGSTATMVYGVQHCIAYLSKFYDSPSRGYHFYWYASWCWVWKNSSAILKTR